MKNLSIKLFFSFPSLNTILYHLPGYLWFAIKSRSLTFFSSTNPKILYGGMIDNSKDEVLGILNQRYLPNSLLHRKEEDHQRLQFRINDWKFPLVVKPNEGERGWGVKIIDNKNELIDWLNRINYDVIIQEYIDYNLELSILYYRYPNELSGNISSVTEKEFPIIEGNEKDTLLVLIKKKYPNFNINTLEEKLKVKLFVIIPFGEKIQLTKVGNIATGAFCINRNDLINATMIKNFDKITEPFEGIYYGRFDLKVPSLLDLYKNENIKILEYNGANCQPLHIYDLNTTLKEKILTLFDHYKTMYSIMKFNKSQGCIDAPLLKFLRSLVGHYTKKQNSPKV